MLKSTIHCIKLLLIFIHDLIFRIKKYLMYIQSGDHEFERTCKEHCDIYGKTMKIDQWLMRTRCERIRDFWFRNIHYKTAEAACLAQKTIDKILLQFKARDRDFEERIQEKKKKKKKKKKENKRKPTSQAGDPADLLLANVEDGDIFLSKVLSEITDEFIKVIEHCKRVKLEAKTEKTLRDTLYRIASYNFSLMVMQKMASIPYESGNKSHTRKLMSLWNNLVRLDKIRSVDISDTVFSDQSSAEVTDDKSIVSSRWSHIGFQGEDPGTDFRGMGILGLEQLEYLSRRPKFLALDLLKRSLNQEHEYPFAIVGINVTYNLLNLFKDGSMKHLYYDCGDALFRNNQQNLKIIKTFNDLYVELFLRFDCFWHESKPENIFAFRELMEKFISVMKMDLCNRTFAFKFIY